MASENWQEAWQPSPQGNQEPLVDKVKIWRPQLSLGWAGLWNAILFPSMLWHCWLGRRKGIWHVKSLVFVCCWWRFDWSFARLIAPVVTATCIIRSCNKIQIGDFLILTSSGCPWKWLLNMCCCHRDQSIVTEPSCCASLVTVYCDCSARSRTTASCITNCRNLPVSCLMRCPKITKQWRRQLSQYAVNINENRNRKQLGKRMLVISRLGINGALVIQQFTKYSECANRDIYICTANHFCLSFTPCGIRSCKNWPAQFPGRMLYKATKPGLVSVLYLTMRYNCGIVVY